MPAFRRIFAVSGPGRRGWWSARNSFEAGCGTQIVLSLEAKPYGLPQMSNRLIEKVFPGEEPRPPYPAGANI